VDQYGQADNRSLGQLFGDLSRQLSTLIRQEIVLARTEMSTKATAVGRDAATIGLGGALLYAAFLTLLGAIVLLLIDLGVPGWVAALGVAVIVGVVGGIMIAAGRQSLTRQQVAPTRTVETLKDDADWAKERIR
jgi:VIT1/CCC1 family predicted Fe2+/Mn2+ transporter